MKLKLSTVDLFEILSPEDLMDYIPAPITTHYPPCDSVARPHAVRSSLGDHELSTTDVPGTAPFRVTCAEHWLRLGDPDSALRELEALPRTEWNHPTAVQIRVAILKAVGRAA